jgi:16S rRNA (cytidine1402-2'-O)-methyltransferase
VRPGTLYVVATPIGNLDDLTYRAVRLLKEMDAVACEDTRYSRRLFDRYAIPRPRLLMSYHDHNERQAAERILGLLDEGKSVGLLSDAGYPGISDPGYVVLSRASEAGHRIEVLPGGSAVPQALLLSGLPTATFTFKGFPPRKPGPLRRYLAMEAHLPHTLIFFESPHRLGAMLAASREVLGDRRAAVCLEMTKMFEDIRRGWLSDLVEHYAGAAPRGEVSVVIAGAHPKFRRGPVAAAQGGTVDQTESP